MEALLAEKSRLANENANLTRENRCLHQLVEYHQLTTQDLSSSYESLIRGMCLDFSSPMTLPEEEEEEGNGMEVKMQILQGQIFSDYPNRWRNTTMNHDDPCEQKKIKEANDIFIIPLLYFS